MAPNRNVGSECTLPPKLLREQLGAASLVCEYSVTGDCCLSVVACFGAGAGDEASSAKAGWFRCSKRHAQPQTNRILYMTVSGFMLEIEHGYHTYLDGVRQFFYHVCCFELIPPFAIVFAYADSRNHGQGYDGMRPSDLFSFFK